MIKEILADRFIGIRWSNKIYIVRDAIQIVARTGLTRSALRWITLSTTSGKEGKKAVLPSFLLAKERGDDPPVGGIVGVSKICARQFELHPKINKIQGLIFSILAYQFIRV